VIGKSIQAGELIWDVVAELALRSRKKQGGKKMNDSQNGENGINRKAVYMVTDSKNADKGIWTRIGTAFENEENTHVILNAFPLGGELYIFDSKKGARGKTSHAGTPSEAVSQ
jgi:hypothetical protein